jgi:hypothetical protein
MAKSRPSKEYKAFTKLTDRLLAVPRATLQKRLVAARDAAAKNPHKRGPKPKSVPSSDAS